MNYLGVVDVFSRFENMLLSNCKLTESELDVLMVKLYENGIRSSYESYTNQYKTCSRFPYRSMNFTWFHIWCDIIIQLCIIH